MIDHQMTIGDDTHWILKQFFFLVAHPLNQLRSNHE